MRPLTIILFLFISLTTWGQKAIIIPDGQEEPFRKVLITSWKGIDAVQLKDGTWFVNESDYKQLPADLTVSVDSVQYVVKDELAKLEVKDLIATDFKVPELITDDPKIITK